jgi:hypothetical protein
MMRITALVLKWEKVLMTGDGGTRDFSQKGEKMVDGKKSFKQKESMRKISGTGKALNIKLL